MQAFNFQSARRLLQAGGPYLLLELVLPGGTLLALLLFLYRRKGSKLAAFAHRIASSRAFRSVTEQIMLPLDVYAWVRGADVRCSNASDDGLGALGMTDACMGRAVRRAPVVRTPRMVRSRRYTGSEIIAIH
jgi:hypothetical protein